MWYILFGDFMPSVLNIAYLGDAVYEVYIRKYLIDHNPGKMKDVQRLSLNYVSANSQRKIIEQLMNKYLTAEEIEIFKTGRNSKSRTCKSTDIITYKYATGFEYLIGYLYLNNLSRLNKLMDIILGDLNGI